MINRGLVKNSQYFFNSETNKLEKKTDNVKTIESLSKQKKKQNQNIEDITSKANDTESKTINSITVITAEDNLIHNYFFDFDHSWDATNCLSTATIKMPKMGTENINYWSTYQGAVTVYGGHDFTFDKVNSNSHSSEQEAANSLSQYNDDSDIKPFFKGTVSRIKEYQTYIVLHLDSIGIRFKQKIPDEFRQSYINNQNVRDAFQAICEFLGVQYICPPQTIEETKTENEMLGGTNTDGTENDVTQQQNTEQQVSNIATSKAQDNAPPSNDNQQNLLSNDNSTGTEGNTDSNQENGQELTDNQEINAPMNGYSDVNFDANGAIVHNSAAIETSPDMAQILINMEENPLEKYLEDETGITEKVQKFLDGDMFEELHNNVMDYGAISIEPKSTTSTDISTTSTGGADTGDQSSTESSDESSGASSGGASSSSTGKTGVAGVWGKTAAGGYYLTQDAINKMSMAEAKRRYEYGKAHEPYYTKATMEKLFWRMMFGTKFY